jgi:hypothetical protein
MAFNLDATPTRQRDNAVRSLEFVQKNGGSDRNDVSGTPIHAAVLAP